MCEAMNCRMRGVDYGAAQEKDGSTEKGRFEGKAQAAKAATAGAAATIRTTCHPFHAELESKRSQAGLQDCGHTYFAGS